MRLFWFLGVSLILYSCKKENTTNNILFTPQPTSETVTAMFLSSAERDINNNGFTSLTVFESNGSIRWKKTGRGSVPDGYITYSNGVIYSSEPQISTTDFYAYNINTGTELWSKTASTERIFYPVVRNDTLFCSTNISTSPAFANITAFNARTGAFIWRKQLSYPYWGFNLLLDGGTLFLMVTTSAVDSKIISFNINTRSVNWESPTLGINLASSFSRIDVSDERVIVKSGTKLLMAFNKSNGAMVWSKPGIPFEQPVIENNLVYSVCARDTYYPVSADSLLGLYAFNSNTGNQVWKWKKKIEYNSSSPFISGNLIFHSGIKKDNGALTETGFLNAFDISTGNEVWNTSTGTAYSQICNKIVSVGNRVYTYKNSSGNPGSNARIVSYDFSTGQLKDSVLLVGENFGKLHIVGSGGKVYSPK